MPGATLIVLFGAAVRADGRPSPALARRIAYAAGAAADAPDAAVLCSGAAGKAGPSEASVMARELAQRGVANDRLILDEDSVDTFQSVLAAARLMRLGGYERLIACSDGYHLPRIRLLFAALGRAAEAGPVTHGQGGGHRLYMALREAAAIPYDLAIVLTRRARLLAEIDAAA
jgi:uncharacterized SAM-binding protein YcdF (DUF218 family)